MILSPKEARRIRGENGVFIFVKDAQLNILPPLKSQRKNMNYHPLHGRQSHADLKLITTLICFFLTNKPSHNTKGLPKSNSRLFCSNTSLHQTKNGLPAPLQNTVVSAYIPPGYKPTSASVPLRNSPTVSAILYIQKCPFLVPPVISTNRLQSSKIVPPNTQKSVGKPTAENHLIKLVNRM